MNTNKTLPNISGKSVFVGLSGGVDSAVSAALLKSQGYDVTGVFIRAWQPEWLPCTWREERRDAMKVCLTLNIPFLFIDAEKEYKEAVVDKMLAEYRAGRTPNPDVLCNREIKFGVFWQKAKALGADFIATGHYVCILTPSDKSATPLLDLGEGKGVRMREGLDSEKDQSYFLWTLTQDDLEHTLFPVGRMPKPEVRKLAKKFGLEVAEKKDSQGICFMGNVSMTEFLSHFIETKPGEVLNLQGEVIGQHKGLIFYTIGERHGFEVNKKSSNSKPFYVVAKDLVKNALIVSAEPSEIVASSPKKVGLININWLREPRDGEAVSARIRYRGEKLKCKILPGNLVEFAEPVAGLSVGQSIVFYSGSELLGGAVMDKVVA